MILQLIKVSARSIPRLVAGAIAAAIREGHAAEVQAVGAGAINQAVKSIAIARTYTEPEGFDIICRPAFKKVMIDDAERTALQFIVEALQK
ncbi:MAG: stage V sporulation protein S [Oscillospiraceae bacterium]|nr:stage V sporulation protein S [Oscillospiraceae bacterium]